MDPEHLERIRNRKASNEPAKNEPPVKSRRALKIGLSIGLILGLIRGLPVLAKSGVSDPEQFGEVVGFTLGLALIGMAIGWVIDRRNNNKMDSVV